MKLTCIVENTGAGGDGQHDDLIEIIEFLSVVDGIELQIEDCRSSSEMLLAWQEASL